MVLKLYAAPLSTASLRVAQVLHEKKVPFEFYPIDLSKRENKAEEYLAKQPFGQVPYIDDDGFILYESRAIARYIALKYPDQGTPLLPSPTDLKAWAIFEQAASNEYSNFEPFAKQIVFEKVLKPRIGQTTNEEVVKASSEQLAAKLDVYDKLLAEQPYLTGQNVSLADLSHIPFGTRLYLAGYGDLIDKRPNVAKWFKSLTERESWTINKNGIQALARRLYRLPVVQKRFKATATEADLFRFTRGRWLCNDEEEHAVRYVPFDVAALKDIAIKAARASFCTSFEKMGEGLMNRVFLLRLDNGRELVARIPFPVSGPKHYTTASEVATMDYVRSELGLPAPQVIAWCSRAETTPVGREFIMYDKIPGTTLSSRWWDMSDRESGKAIQDIIRVEAKTVNTRFSQIGSLYYKKDLPAHLQERTLYPEGIPSTQNSERFRMGPSVYRDLWKGGRAALDIDRGPCKYYQLPALNTFLTVTTAGPDLHSYALALSSGERRMLQQNPHPRLEEHLELLDDYDKLMPSILPRTVPFILWHPDFHGENIILNDDGPISGVIDWQSSVIGPFFTQIASCPMLQFTGSPYVDFDPEIKKLTFTSEYHEADEEGKNKESEICSRHKESLEEAPEVDLVAQPLKVVTRGVQQGLPVIRDALMRVIDNWDICFRSANPGTPIPPCPVQYSEATRERQKVEFERLQMVTGMTQILEKDIGYHPSGFVEMHEFEKAKAVNEKLKEGVLRNPNIPEEERDLLIQDWPVQEGKNPVSAEVCQ
ncbi:hypothetical protein NMY22_g18643 [Coprinellus aureogranulatus]|nr:hypothetical protein NMY22_g18643 [Coprinellus aureogranulatus]